MAPVDGTVLWQVQRRPHGRMLAWVLVLGFLFACGSALLVPMLMTTPDPVLAAATGLGLSLVLVFSLCQGSTVRVERGARLIYALRGQDCVAVDLRRVTGFRYIATGALSGIGVEVPLDALTFLSRKGVSRRQCEATAKHLGAALVLEFLRPEDLEPLCLAWKASLE